MFYHAQLFTQVLGIQTQELGMARILPREPPPQPTLKLAKKEKHYIKKKCMMKSINDSTQEEGYAVGMSAHAWNRCSTAFHLDSTLAFSYWLALLSHFL